MLNYGIKGEFFWETVDNITKNVISASPAKKNLILNQGLTNLGTYSFVDSVSNCVVSSNTSTPLFTDVALSGEFARTSTLDTSINNYALTSLVGNVYSFTRVFKFPVNINPAFYGSIGWSYTSTPGNNIFSKSLILDTNGNPNLILLNQGQYLRVYYTISLTINSTQVSGASNIVGLQGVDGGNYGIQLIGLKKLNSDGTVGYWDSANDANELNSQSEIFVSTSTSGLSLFGASSNRSAGTNYTAKSSNINLGNGLVIKKGNFGKGNAVNTGIYSIGNGVIGSSYTNSSFAYLFSNPQSKVSSYLLSTQFLYSATRM